MRLDRKGFVRMGRLLILTLLISGCSEEQKVKWEVNKQIRRLKSKITICFAVGRRFDSEGGTTRSSSSDSRPIASRHRDIAVDVHVQQRPAAAPRRAPCAAIRTSR